MTGASGRRDAITSLLVGSVFLAAFVAAYLVVPFNPTIPGTRIQMRPEPLVLVLAFPFGRTAVVGAAGGVLVHNVAFRLSLEITPFFVIAQTATALVAGLVGVSAWTRVTSTSRVLVAPAAFVAVFVPVLGIASAIEIGASPLEEMLHIFEEVLIPQLLAGPLALAGLESTRARFARRARTVG